VILDQPQRITSLQARLERVLRRMEAVRRIEVRYPWLRLAAVLAWLAGTYLAVNELPAPFSWGVSAALLAVFIAVTLLHQQVLASLERYQALEFLTRARLARCALDWPNIPAHQPIAVSPDHPFDRDLIVTGPRSLHHLLDSTASAGGSRALAGWLLETHPSPSQTLTRQNQVRELIALPGLRARLALDGALIAGPFASSQARAPRWDGDALIHWLGQTSRAAALRPYLIVLGLLAAANLFLFFLHAAGLLPAWWVLTLLIYLALQSLKFRESSEVFQQADELARRLKQLHVVLADLESYPWRAESKLADLCAPFRQGEGRPSWIVRRAGLIATAASLHGNPFLSLILNLLIPWDLFFAYQLERLKGHLRAVLPAWLETWYTLEALCALAEFAILNPGYAFPDLLEPDAGMIFKAYALGHPLIRPSARVTNPFTIERLGMVILITGSNMSGKSTFLRAVGANLCLAYAGSVVCAESLQTLPFRLFASMNVADSLNDGISFFYAEVRRLKALLDALQSTERLPLFFLIDEIFRGTNNRERRIGSEAYLRALAGQHGAGIISTHDLELVRLEQEIPQVRNYHFRETVEGDRMVFDYRLRPGPSPTTNALRIMALAGLPVKPPDP